MAPTTGGIWAIARWVCCQLQLAEYRVYGSGHPHNSCCCSLRRVTRSFVLPTMFLSLSDMYYGPLWNVVVVAADVGLRCESKANRRGLWEIMCDSSGDSKDKLLLNPSAPLLRGRSYSSQGGCRLNRLLSVFSVSKTRNKHIACFTLSRSLFDFYHSYSNNADALLWLRVHDRWPRVCVEM